MSPSTPDPNRRSEHSHRAILTATVELISELGYDKVTVEAIAKRAGVGKQTIYRWWPSKGAIALEALNDTVETVVDFPDSGDIVEDLRTQMKGLTEMFGSTAGRVYQGVLSAAQSDPTLARTLLENLIAPINAGRLERIALAQERGEIRADVDPQELIDMLYGAMYWRLMLHTRPLEPEQIDAALDIASAGVRPAPTKRKSKR